jgi:hypothetical protein
MDSPEGKKLDPAKAKEEWKNFFAGTHDEKLMMIADVEPTTLDVNSLPWIMGLDALAAGNITGVFGGDALQTSRDQVLVD